MVDYTLTDNETAAETVDRFLADAKALEGIPEWVVLKRDSVQVARYVIASDGIPVPPTLEYAKVLPAQIRRLDQALRWMCDITNINLDNSQVLKMPPRTKLL